MSSSASDLQQQVKVPLRESPSSRSASRPTSIADRLSQLSVSQQTWTSKVQDKDMKQFTVEEKLGRITGNSSVLPIFRVAFNVTSAEMRFYLSFFYCVVLVILDSRI